MIFEIFFLKNGTDLRAKVELFLVLPKFDWKKIFQKFQKKMVQGRVETNKKCSRRLTNDHLLAVSSRQKSRIFKGPHVKSRSN
jgi:hypothetical protein